MDKLPTATIDVRDMLCAQALAVVAKAAEALPSGGLFAVRYNAEDVRRDLLAWALDRGHQVNPVDSTTLRLRRA